jgi:hypothetical protein
MPMTLSARDFNFIKYFMRPDKTYFEWGSGGSTIHLSKCVKNITSIEHDKGVFLGEGGEAV